MRSPSEQPQSDATLYADRVITPTSVLSPGWVRVRRSVVEALGAGKPATRDTVHLPHGSTIVPGLVDMHVHGAGGGDMTAPVREEVVRALTALVRAGVTSCVASTVTAPLRELESSLDLIADITETPVPGAARLLGAHLEGPFLARELRGAHHEPSLLAPAGSTAERLVDAARGSLRMMTLAPELPGASDVLALLRSHGVVAAMGHTAATFDQTRDAVDRGVRVGTHLFNGMRSAHHREPGPALSLLDDDRVVVELINDGVHVHPVVVRVAARAAGVGRLALISDGVAATAAPDGLYRLGRVQIRSQDGRVETADGSSLGGGVTTLDWALRRAVLDLDLSLQDAVTAVTATPARALGVDSEVGSITVGHRADLCVLDQDLQISGVMVGGEWIGHAPWHQTSESGALLRREPDSR